MEKIFQALGHHVRLWIVLRLMADGPQRQVELVAALNASSVVFRAVAASEMTQLLRPLFDAGLIARDRPRGPISLRGTEQIQRLLATASALDVAITGDASQKAQQAHADLMRTITGLLPSAASGS